LALSVDAGELGELSLVVDRTKAGIRVTIGVSDASALQAVGPERAALERALSATGLSIDSVRVVAQNAGGTVLAPSQKAPQTQRTQTEPHRINPWSTAFQDLAVRRRQLRSARLWPATRPWVAMSS
jgi:hypothetical protein